jgi:hypothetical protein
VQFIHFGVAAFKELDKQVTFLVAGLDAFENSCNIVLKMIWDVVVQGQNWLLPVVEQLVEFRSLHALFGVGYECACQELTHLLFDGSFAALDILWIDIEISFELVLLFTVSLRLLKMNKLHLTSETEQKNALNLLSDSTYYLFLSIKVN